MVPVRRALRLVIEGKAEIVESDDGDVIRSERLVLPKPAIIRLVKFVHVPRRFRRQVTNTFLFARDNIATAVSLTCGIASVSRGII
jgi:5-methylcytosine-specific restriction endonuclease McrA